MKQNVLLDKTFKFAVDAVRLSQKIQTEKKEFIITRQFLKAATSIGANAEEALAAQSKADFIAKLTIAQKEARETRYWLRLISASEIMDCTPYLSDIEEINRLIASILITTKKNQDINIKGPE